MNSTGTPAFEPAGRLTPHFVRELDDLRGQLVTMGHLVEERVRRAVRSLQQWDSALAQTVVDGDREVNEAHIAIDGRCFTLLALHQPMAGDLRTIVAGVKMASDLERVGDLAVNIAQAVLRALPQPALSMPPGLERMAGLAIEMLHDALAAFETSDVASAQRVLGRDDTLDQLTAKMFREFLDAIRRDPSVTESAINLILVSRHLERVGDHATNIAEDVIFVVTARDVRHTGGVHRPGPAASTPAGGGSHVAEDH